MVRTGNNNDDGFRSVAIILALLGTLAVLSFVMAGVVGARETSVQPHTLTLPQSN